MSEKQGLWGRNDPMKSGAWRGFSLAAYDPAGNMTDLTDLTP
jgi:hypothetical protein